ncbi:TPA: inovirus Gp2 family protein [Aeromonas veronii]|nr:inovirus Gp2 family protein [Aeromonas veronii]
MNNSIRLTPSERQHLFTQLETRYKSAVDENIFFRLEETLEKAFTEYRRLSLIRLDLRFANGEPHQDMPTCFQQTDRNVITRFIASLKSQLDEQARRKRQNGVRVYPCRIRYLWVLEQDEALLPHYHLILMLNKDAHAFLGQVQRSQSTGLIRIIQEAWCRALSLSHDDYSTLVHVPDNALIHLTREDALDRTSRHQAWLHRAGYLAKQETKCIGQARRCFGASQG